jgi:hypothetical protein
LLFYLFQSGARFYHCLHAIPDNHQHVAVFSDVPLIGHTAVTRNDLGSAILVVHVDAVEDEIEPYFPVEKPVSACGA